MNELEKERSVKKYSQAILQIACEKNMLEELNNDMKKLQVFFDIVFADSSTKKDYLIITRNFAILSHGKKVQILQDIAKTIGIKSFTYNFLTLLMYLRKLYILRKMAREWEHIFLEYNKYFKVVVRSVIPLSDEQEEAIKQMIAKEYGHKFYLDKRIDKSMLGGLMITFKGYTYDDSLRGQLVKIKSV